MTVSKVAGVAALIAFAFVAALLWDYRARKLTLLEPAKLAGNVVWRGPSQARCRMLLIGDSRVAYWPIAPRSGWRVGKLGFPGQTAANIAQAAEPILASSKLDVVAIQAGGNDAAAAALSKSNARPMAGRAAAAIARLALAARAQGAKRVIVLNLVPPIEPDVLHRIVYGDRIAEFMDDVSKLLEKEAAAGKFELLDANKLFRTRTGQLDRSVRRDWIHWNIRGYEKLDQALNRLIDGTECD